jgi:choline-sulfatase
MEGNLPLLPIPKYKKMYYDNEKVRDARYPEQLKQIMYYYAELRYIDDQLDDFLKSIEKYKWYDNALVIVTSAHGISLGEWGHWGHSIGVNEWDVKIPMLVKYPEQKDGAVIEYPVQTADIFPTMLEAAGLAAPKGIDGINLKKDDQNRFITIVQKPSAWVVDKYDNQYIRILRAFIIGDEKIILSSNGPPQVYNLKEDPEERHNIATERMEIVRKASAEFNKRSAVKMH